MNDEAKEKLDEDYKPVKRPYNLTEKKKKILLTED